MILCVDLETTGLNEQESGIVEICACWLHNGAAFHRKCRPLPTARIDPQALEMNGWTPERIADPELIPEELAISEFIGWVRGSDGLNEKVQIAAWNAHFDHRHLCAGMDRAGIDGRHRPFIHRLLDVHSILAARELERTFRASLVVGNLLCAGGEIKNSDAGSELLGLAPEPKPHGAIAGANQVRAMLRRLLGDLSALP